MRSNIIPFLLALSQYLSISQYLPGISVGQGFFYQDLPGFSFSQASFQVFSEFTSNFTKSEIFPGFLSIFQTGLFHPFFELSGSLFLRQFFSFIYFLFKNQTDFHYISIYALYIMKISLLFIYIYFFMYIYAHNWHTGLGVLACIIGDYSFRVFLDACGHLD